MASDFKKLKSFTCFSSLSLFPQTIQNHVCFNSPTILHYMYLTYRYVIIYGRTLAFDVVKTLKSVPIFHADWNKNLVFLHFHLDKSYNSFTYMCTRSRKTQTWKDFRARRQPSRARRQPLWARLTRCSSFFSCHCETQFGSRKTEGSLEISTSDKKDQGRTQQVSRKSVIGSNGFPRRPSLPDPSGASDREGTARRNWHGWTSGVGMIYM